MWQMVKVAKFDKSNMTRFLESGFVVPLAMFVKKRADNFGIFDGICHLPISEFWKGVRFW